jgi:hypothetical protein
MAYYTDNWHLQLLKARQNQLNYASTCEIKLCILLAGIIAQTPLVRFVVDLLYNKLHSNSTTNPQQTHNKSITFRLFDKSTTSRHITMLRICCGLDNKSTTNRSIGVWLSTCPQQVKKLYNKSATLRQVVQLVVQQIHSKSNKWSLSFSQHNLSTVK